MYKVLRTGLPNRYSLLFWNKVKCGKMFIQLLLIGRNMSRVNMSPLERVAVLVNPHTNSVHRPNVVSWRHVRWRKLRTQEVTICRWKVKLIAIGCPLYHLRRDEIILLGTFLNGNTPWEASKRSGVDETLWNLFEAKWRFIRESDFCVSN